MKEKYAKEPVLPDLQNKWQSGWWWPLKIVNHNIRLSRTRSCLSAKAWARPCSLCRASVSPKFCHQSGLPNGPQRTQEDQRGLKRDYWIRIHHSDRVFNHFSLQQILEQKNRGCQLHVTFLSKSLCVRAGILYYLHFQIPSVFAVLFSVSCHVLHLSISALSGAILKLRISQMVAQLSLESKQSQLSAERHQIAPN